ncbi:MAG: ankyrin repeat domain-containing protein [Nitrospira sp.]|nr:ankyrin repeat domain-containing protein [Nitrospira sp.]MBH0182726.1 ankyrin repeat domain-containing protein [Nitrospira sp.]
MTRQTGKIALVLALLPVLLALRPIDEDLFLATFLGDRAKVEALFQDGANAQVEKEDETTPLHLAARQGHRQIIEELLKHGADKSAMTTKGKRPVDIARAENHPEIILLLEP